MKNCVFRCIKDGNKIIVSHTNGTQGLWFAWILFHCHGVWRWRRRWSMGWQSWSSTRQARSLGSKAIRRWQHVDCIRKYCSTYWRHARHGGYWFTRFVFHGDGAWRWLLRWLRRSRNRKNSLCHRPYMDWKPIGLRQSDRNTLLDHNKCLNDKILNAAQKVGHSTVLCKFGDVEIIITLNLSN